MWIVETCKSVQVENVFHCNQHRRWTTDLSSKTQKDLGDVLSLEVFRKFLEGNFGLWYLVSFWASWGFQPNLTIGFTAQRSAFRPNN